MYFKFRVRKFMKLFKSLLVAPATLGLLAPVAATANEVTISDFAPAEQLAITNSRVDGLEARLNNFEAGSFSETTTASFSTDFAIGSVDGVSYTFPLGELTAIVGDNTDGSALFTTACAYGGPVSYTHLRAHET